MRQCTHSQRNQLTHEATNQFRIQPRHSWGNREAMYSLTTQPTHSRRYQDSNQATNTVNGQPRQCTHVAAHTVIRQATHSWGNHEAIYLFTTQPTHSRGNQHSNQATNSLMEQLRGNVRRNQLTRGNQPIQKITTSLLGQPRGNVLTHEATNTVIRQATHSWSNHEALYSLNHWHGKQLIYSSSIHKCHYLDLTHNALNPSSRYEF